MQCWLYRAVSLEIMDQLQDSFNMAHACQLADKAKIDIAVHQALGFNELYEAALKKKSEAKQIQAKSDPMDINLDSI